MKKLLVVGAVSLMLVLTGCGAPSTGPTPQPGPLGPNSQCAFGEELEPELDGTWECDDDDHKKKKATTAPKAPVVKPVPKAVPKPAPKSAPKTAPKSSTTKK